MVKIRIVRSLIAVLALMLLTFAVGCTGSSSSDSGGSSAAWTNPSSLTDNLSPNGQDVHFPQVAMDNSGDAIVVWYQNDGVETQIYKAEYRGGSWTTPASLADIVSIDGHTSVSPMVAMDNNGNAIIVWSQYDGSFYQVFKAEYRSGSWTFPASISDNISPDGTHTGNPQVAMSDDGTAVITWLQPDGSNQQVYRSTYDGSTWTNPANLADNISPDGQDASYAKVAMDASGNAIIIWEQSDGSATQIFKSEYRSGAWTDPSSLTDNISPDGQLAGQPEVAMDNNGNAIITWTQYNGSNYLIYKSEYRSAAWANPLITDYISPDGQNAVYPEVAMDDNGNAIITWQQYDGTNTQIFKSEYRSGSWTNPSSLTDHISIAGQNTTIPQVAMDDNGNAIITWPQSDGTTLQIFKSEYRSGAWTNPSALTDNISPDGQDTHDVQVAMSDHGTALITWDQSDATSIQTFMSIYK